MLMPFLDAFKRNTRQDFDHVLHRRGTMDRAVLSPGMPLVAYKAVFDLAAAKEELRQTKEDHAKLLGGCQARVEQQLAKKIALQVCSIILTNIVRSNKYMTAQV